MTPGEVLLDPRARGLAAEQALQIARLDAEAAYGNLGDFRITIARQANGWHIDYDLQEATRAAAALTTSSMPGRGQILAKRYEQ